MAEHTFRARTGAVIFYRTFVEDALKEVEILFQSF